MVDTGIGPIWTYEPMAIQRNGGLVDKCLAGYGRTEKIRQLRSPFSAVGKC